MKNRERFLAVLNGDAPDRVPVVANLTEQLAEKLARELSLPVEMQDSFLATRISHRQILLALGNDAVLVAPTRPTAAPTVRIGEGRVRDEFGIEYETVGLYSEAVLRPLGECETPQDVQKYNFPKADAPGRWDFAEQIIALHKNEYGLIGDLEASIFELAWNLVGMEKFIMDLMTGEEYVPVLLDRIQEYTTACGLKLIDMGVDMVWTGDDVGTQSAMMMSPDLWREHFKPRMQQMFAAFKERNPNIKIAYHSCGAVAPIIPELIEIGLDILNPLQPLAEGMELSQIYQKYHEQLMFFGGVDVQNVLPNGSLKDVEDEVKRCFAATGGGNRFIIAPSHNMQPDTPVANVYAFFKAVREHCVIQE